jgi:enterochelin esterase-like enzyme
MALAGHLRTSGADVEAVVVPGEHHMTVWPAASARGLRHLYLA